MQPKNLEKSIKKLKEASDKRNFKQTIDLIINLKDLNLKKSEEQLDLFVLLHHSRGKAPKICVFSGPELKDEAQKNCDTIITQEDFVKYAKDKKLTKKLAKSHDFFIAQANIMPQVAQTFGKVLGVRGKMPNPKAGCVVPPKANLAQLVEKLRKTVRVIAKVQPLVQLPVGFEEMSEAQIADNIVTVFNQVIHNLPNEKNNIKSVFVKTTMGPCFELDLNGDLVEREKPVKEKSADSQDSSLTSSQAQMKEEEPVKEKAEEKKEAKKETKPTEDKKD